MTLTTVSPASGAPFDALEPLRLPAALRLTPEQFELAAKPVAATAGW